MKVFVAFEVDYDDYSLHGIFSTREKAEAYASTREVAQKALRLRVSSRDDIQIDEYELDELADLTAVFAAHSYVQLGEKPKVSVQYLAEVPETEYFSDNGEVYAVVAWALTPKEAREKAIVARDALRAKK